MGKYLDPKADLTFKKVFGEHADLVTSLLNALLPLSAGEVESIEYLQPEVVPDDPLHKDSILDVRCKDPSGRQFVVEMQMIWTTDYNQRTLFNAAKTYVRQLSRGGDYQELKTVYSLNLINDVIYPDLPGYWHHYQLEHHAYKGKVIDGIQLIFVELPKFTPNQTTDSRMRQLWMRFLTEIDEDTRKAPPELEAEPEVKRALDMVEESAMNDAERAHYDGFIDWLRRQRGEERRKKELLDAIQSKEAELVSTNAKLASTKSELDTAKSELDTAKSELDTAKSELDTAKSELIVEKERAEGAEKKLQRTVQRLLESGLTVDQVAETTGISLEEIQNVKRG